jgi:ankyrin repeat protein
MLAEDVPTVDVLLRAGADPNRKNKWGATALMIAAANGQKVMVSHLLSVGADPAAKDSYGDDAAGMAAERQYVELAELLRRASTPSVASHRAER